MSLAYFEYNLDLHGLYYSDESEQENEPEPAQNVELDKKFCKAIKDMDLSTIKSLIENDNYDITRRFNSADTILDGIYASSIGDSNVKFKMLEYALQTSLLQKGFTDEDLQYGLRCMLENAPFESIKYLVEFKPEVFKDMQLYDHNLEDLDNNIFEQASVIRKYLVDKGLKLES